MCHANNEKRKTILDGRNRFTKSKQNQNAPRKGNLQIPWNTGSGHHQTSGDERKKLKSVSHEMEKLLETTLYSRNLIKE